MPSFKAIRSAITRPSAPNAHDRHAKVSPGINMVEWISKIQTKIDYMESRLQALTNQTCPYEYHEGITYKRSLLEYSRSMIRMKGTILASHAVVINTLFETTDRITPLERRTIQFILDTSIMTNPARIVFEKLLQPARALQPLQPSRVPQYDPCFYSDRRGSSPPPLAPCFNRDRRVSPPPPLAPRFNRGQRGSSPPPLAPRFNSDRRGSSPPPLAPCFYGGQRGSSPPPLAPCFYGGPTSVHYLCDSPSMFYHQPPFISDRNYTRA